uniref:(northern house mosquito) hypothetical protein n=1 Tax=Culex pipiens TaxID=7175 RepID=A0A8D8AHT2_CULPI
MTLNRSRKRQRRQRRKQKCNERLQRGSLERPANPPRTSGRRSKSTRTMTNCCSTNSWWNIPARNRWTRNSCSSPSPCPGHCPSSTASPKTSAIRNNPRSAAVPANRRCRNAASRAFGPRWSSTGSSARATTRTRI